MRFIKRLTAALVCAVLLAPLCASADESKGVLYHVTGGKNDLYLLGSIHIGNEAMYPVSGAISEALEAADTLVLECDTESAAVSIQMAAMMSYPLGESLKDNVTDETWELLRKVCDKPGYDINMLNALRPWAVTSMLAVESTAAEMGMSDITEAIALGVEAQIGSLAPGKPRVYLETAIEQLQVLSGFSPELQEYMLYSTLMTIAAPGEYIQAGDAGLSNWPDWWREGEAEKFADSYLEGMASDPEPELMLEYHNGLVTKRNATMAQGLGALLEGSEPHGYFAIVGLLHLVLPEDSVVSLLADMGYTVERVM